jgi:hypothetical protein
MIRQKIVATKEITGDLGGRIQRGRVTRSSLSDKFEIEPNCGCAVAENVCSSFRCTATYSDSLTAASGVVGCTVIINAIGGVQGYFHLIIVVWYCPIGNSILRPPTKTWIKWSRSSGVVDGSPRCHKKWWKLLELIMNCTCRCSRHSGTRPPIHITDH